MHVLGVFSSAVAQGYELLVGMRRGATSAGGSVRTVLYTN